MRLILGIFVVVVLDKLQFKYENRIFNVVVSKEPYN